MRARVTVYPRAEVLDPQGRAIRDALDRIGFGEVRDVRAGKSYEIEIEPEDGPEDRAAGEERLDEMCRRLLANPVVEDYTVELLGEEPA